MDSPTRLLKSCPHPEARELLRAGIAEAPRPAAVRATALALGLGAGVGVTSAAGAAGATLAAGSLATTSALVVGKWVAVGTLAGLALAGSASVLTSHGTTPREAPPAVRTNPHPSPPLVPRATEPPSSPAGEQAPVMPAPAPIGAAPATSPPPAAASARVDSNLPSSALLPGGRDLGREVAQIDAARRAVATGNGQAALHHLDQYAALDRTSTLDREAQLLRIDASLLVGSNAEALRLAQAYLSQYPADPHSARLRALVENP